MSLEIADLADALAATLNASALAGAYSQKFMAKRRYLPIMDLASNELADLKVSVSATAIEQLRQDRASIIERPTIFVAVQKKVAAATATVLDPLMLLVSEINRDLWDKSLTIHADAILMALNRNPLFDPQGLHESLVFSSLLACTFRVR